MHQKKCFTPGTLGEKLRYHYLLVIYYYVIYIFVIYVTNIKKRNKKIFKIRNSLNLNNVNFNNNKKTSGSRASRDLGKGANIIKNRFKCFYTNATSLSNKLASLETLFAMEDPDAVFVSETWYNENSCPGFENYTLHRKDRVGQRMGGGVCIYIKKSIDYYS